MGMILVIFLIVGGITLKSQMMMVKETIRRMEQGMLQQQPDRILCPFVLRPFDQCYCASTSSLLTEATIHYCGGNFEDCEIFKKHAEAGEIGG